MLIDFRPKPKPKQELTIELVPRTSWYTNVRSMISTREWDVIRKRCYKEADYVCEVCGGVGPKWPVECHEIWVYDDKKHAQMLEGLIALCPKCHQVKHIGFAQVQGKGKQAAKHLAMVNGWSPTKTDRYIAAAFALWSARSDHEWDVNITYLEKYMKEDRA